MHSFIFLTDAPTQLFKPETGLLSAQISVLYVLYFLYCPITRLPIFCLKEGLIVSCICFRQYA
jgi:hypothetical protein